MTHRFVHVTFGFHGVPKILDLEPVFSEMGDWVRFTNTGWLLWTDMYTIDINKKLIRVVDVNDHYLISAVDINQLSALIPNWIWDWIISKAPPNTFTVGPPAIGAYGADIKRLGKK